MSDEKKNGFQLIREYSDALFNEKVHISGNGRKFARDARFE